jgi:hypothetical protein
MTMTDLPAAAADVSKCWYIAYNVPYTHSQDVWGVHYPTRTAALAAAAQQKREFSYVEPRSRCGDYDCLAARTALFEKERQATAIAAVQARDAEPLAAARWLVEAASGEITRADAKAGFVVTLQLAALLAVGDHAAGIDGPLRWAAGICLLAGVLIAAWVVVPRLPRRRTAGPSQPALNFAAVRELTADQLAEQLRGGQLEATCAEAAELGRIAHTKHQVLRWSMLTGLTGLLLATLTIFAA